MCMRVPCCANLAMLHGQVTLFEQDPFVRASIYPNGDTAETGVAQGE
jgi:hypothetical protein